MLRVTHWASIAAIAFVCSLGCNFDLAAPGGSSGGAGGVLTGGAGGTEVEGGSPSVGGGSGGGPSNGCSCGLEEAWSAVTHTGNVIAEGPDRTLCEDGEGPLKLYFGEQEVACEDCACEASGCEPEPLHCHASNGCAGNHTVVQPSTSCSSIGGGECRSARVPGPAAPPSCATTGGTLSGAPYAYQAGFCESSECEAGCFNPATSCLVAPGFDHVCPPLLEYRYELWASAQAVCPACGCTASCIGPDYEAGFVDCTDYTVESGCVTFPIQAQFFRKTKQADCEVFPAGMQAPIIETDSGYTVCCASPLTPEGTD